MKRKPRPPSAPDHLTVSMSPECIHRVKLMAKASEVTVSQFVRQLIQERWQGHWPVDDARDPYT